MRLIDVDKLTDGKGVFSGVIHADFKMKGGGYVDIEDLLTILDNQPTAYDVDKVVEQLENERKVMHRANGTAMGRKRIVTIDKAIEIVKSGSIISGNKKANRRKKKVRRKQLWFKILKLAKGHVTKLTKNMVSRWTKRVMRLPICPK